MREAIIRGSARIYYDLMSPEERAEIDLIAAHIEQRRSVLGADSDDQICAELDQLVERLPSPRRTRIDV